ncbi:MAG: DNA gyrase subunit B [Clostridiales bacterium]|nr:DNA gyrase subunit B [Clostridiales bacterium]
MSKNYTAENIQVLEGLDAVRMRPGMYIGTTGIKGLHHILWELVDNAMDEVANGFGNKINVIIYEDGSASVEDNGRGVPVDIHPTMKISGVEVVYTQLHAGGKFDNSNYTHSGGLHGVGASVTNALSRWMTVNVFKNGTTYQAEFESPEVKGVVKSGLVKTHLFDTKKKTKKTGTFVRFMPDDRVFETIKFNSELITRRLKELAFLNKGAKIVFEDRRVAVGNGYQTVEFCYEGGLKDFVIYLNELKKPVFDNPIFFSGIKDNIAMEVAIQYNDSYTESMFSYVNNIPTPEGGTHETGFKVGLTRVLNDFARKLGILKDKDANLQGDDFREGITAVISVKMQNVQFEGQTKTKLGNTEAKQACEAITLAELPAFLEKNKSVTEIILKKAQLAAKVREATRKQKELTRAKNSIDSFNTVGKLKSCSGKKAELNELFIVEGDSAGGTCTQARNRSFQAILPLRGKPLNAEKKRLDKVLENEEIKTLISALGAGLGEEFNPEDLKYGKVVILSDADQDGYHIRCILLTFFFRYMKELITEGHVYIGMPPLYKISKKNETRYVYSDEELDKAKEEMGRSCEIQRYKGLGEMNAEQLWSTTLDPQRRKMIKVSIEDVAEAEKMVTVLMGDAVDQRKAYIVEHSNFNKKDAFIENIK